jgi:catechol 2,3-dioxygenase-like lactoylglutathione lyase family enzyme
MSAGSTDMRVGLLDHYNVRTRKLAETVDFYEGVLGLDNGPRPAFDFPGAWLYSEGKPVVHLRDITPLGEAQKPDSGVVHHIAFVSSGFRQMKQHLAGKGIAFETSEVPGGELWQIFVRDPNGIMIELNYDTAMEGLNKA